MLSRNVRHALIWALAIVIAAGVLVLAIWLVPLLVTRSAAPGLTGAARLRAQDNVRTPVVAALAVVGAAALTAGVTWRATKTAQRTQELTDQGQVTDRYGKAIDQLGNDHLAVQTGGIYALERITHDSPRDQPTIMEVLATFARGVSNLQWSPPEPPRTTPLAVQAALTVIGRREHIDDELPIDLSGAKLPQADLHQAKLATARLVGTELSAADLTGADLTGADLTGAHLTYAWITAANLTGAHLTGADLTGADLTGADLTGAHLAAANVNGKGLPGVNLTGANLTDTNLTGGDLTGVNLTRANLVRTYLIDANLDDANLDDARLDGAYLDGALWPPGMTAPVGWKRDTNSGRLKRADANPSGTPAG